eukprot:jgi/Pico_ML_1/55565/g1234.t1
MAKSASRRVAVLATRRTVQGKRLARLCHTYAKDADVFLVPMVGLAELVEAGEVDGPQENGVKTKNSKKHENGSDTGRRRIHLGATGCQETFEGAVRRLIRKGALVLDGLVHEDLDQVFTMTGSA